MESKNVENEKQNLIKFIESNFDLNLKFNDQHALKEYKFKHFSFNITAIVRDILIMDERKLYRIAESFDVKGDLDSIHQAKSECRKFVNKYAKSISDGDRDILRIYRKLENLELKMIWMLLPETIKKQYFRKFMNDTYHISIHDLKRLADELFY